MNLFRLAFILSFFMLKIIIAAFYVLSTDFPDELNSWADTLLDNWTTRYKSSSNNFSGWSKFLFILLFIKSNLQQSMIMLINWLTGLTHIEIVTNITFVSNADNGLHMANITFNIFMDKIISINFLFNFDLSLDFVLFNQIFNFYFILLFNLFNIHFL